ncbi:putative pectinesterase 29 [Senna tora]|uniref:Putative pectinesterase 29 n=1 Tax=Senna tora TaxID=362788 RepID=A0A834TJZ4_9FABA|nr:putative pectinesterase 29 [Senna tora]
MGGVINESGFWFKNSNITGNGIGKLMLGRGYGEYSRVIIANSFLGNIVSPLLGMELATSKNIT